MPYISFNAYGIRVTWLMRLFNAAVIGKNYNQAAEPDSSLTVNEEEIKYLTEENKRKKINELRRAMEKAAKELDFAEAARLRDAIKMFNK